MCGRTDTVEALIKHGANVYEKATRVSSMNNYVNDIKRLCFVPFYLLLLSFLYYFYTVNGMPCFHFV